MKKFKAKDLLIPGLVLFIISLATTLFLALTYKVTAPKIEVAKNRVEKEARQEVLSKAVSFSRLPLEVTHKNNRYLYFEGKDSDGQTVGYVFKTSEKGYGGDIEVMTGIDSGGYITGVKILRLTETPGLGMNADNPSFLNQYVGKNKNVWAQKAQDAAEGDVVALTGATVTSNAVSSAVNTALELYKAVSSPDDGPSDDPDYAAKKAALPQALSFEEAKANLKDGSQVTYNIGKTDEGEVVGYVFLTEAQGHKNPISVMTGFDTQGLITGVEIMFLDDTPGFGDKVYDEDFLNQFKGLDRKIKTGNDEVDSQVKVQTGSSNSSRGVMNAVNNAVDLYQEIIGG